MRVFKKQQYKVIQWATGNQGRFQIGMIASDKKPHLKLVGCWVHSEDKVGRDAGAIAGVKPLGVKATNSEADLLAMEADCILYSAFYPDVDLICRMLESGKNVLTQLGMVYLHKDDPRRARIEAACRKGGTAFHAAGINTGFFSDRLCTELTSLNGEVERLQCVEYSHDSLKALSPFMIFDAMGFGWTQERLDKEEPPLFSGLNDDCFHCAAAFTAAAMGFEVERRESSHQFIMTKRDMHAYGRDVKAGTVGAIRTFFRYFSGGKERLTYIQSWKIAPDIETDWGYDKHPKAFYQMSVTGKPSYKVYWEPEGDGMEDALYSTGATLVNAIPLVCDAAPGIHTQIDLPMICFTGNLN